MFGKYCWISDWSLLWSDRPITGCNQGSLYVHIYIGEKPCRVYYIARRNICTYRVYTCKLYISFYVPETHIMYFIRRWWFLKCSEEIHYVPIGDGDLWYYVPVDDAWEEVLGHNVYNTSQYFSPNANIELHRPGIEPGPPAWHASILPLNQRCCFNIQINPVCGHLYQILYPLDWPGFAVLSMVLSKSKR